METVDLEFMEAAIDFIKRQHEAGKPFFVWFNTTWMHFRVHIPDSIMGKSGRWQSEYHDAMIEHDRQVACCSICWMKSALLRIPSLSTAQTTDHT
jgi:arylsulfatase